MENNISPARNAYFGCASALFLLFWSHFGNNGREGHTTNHEERKCGQQPHSYPRMWGLWLCMWGFIIYVSIFRLFYIETLTLIRGCGLLWYMFLYVYRFWYTNLHSYPQICGFMICVYTFIDVYIKALTLHIIQHLTGDVTLGLTPTLIHERGVLWYMVLHVHRFLFTNPHSYPRMRGLCMWVFMTYIILFIIMLYKMPYAPAHIICI